MNPKKKAARARRILAADFRFHAGNVTPEWSEMGTPALDRSRALARTGRVPLWGTCDFTGSGVDDCFVSPAPVVGWARIA